MTLELTGDLTPKPGEALPSWGASPPAVIAFDVGAEMGWAMLSEARGFSSGTIDRGLRLLDAEWTRAVRGRLIWATEQLEDERLVVAVEDTFLASSSSGPKGKSSHHVTVMAHLSRYVGAVIALAAQLGLGTYRVRPHSWQSAILGKVPRAQGKALSVARARSTFGDRVSSEHEADASLLALFVRGAVPTGVRPRGRA